MCASKKTMVNVPWLPAVSEADLQPGSAGNGRVCKLNALEVLLCSRYRATCLGQQAAGTYSVALSLRKDTFVRTLHVALLFLIGAFLLPFQGADPVCQRLASGHQTPGAVSAVQAIQGNPTWWGRKWFIYRNVCCSCFCCNLQTVWFCKLASYLWWRLLKFCLLLWIFKNSRVQSILSPYFK